MAGLAWRESTPAIDCPQLVFAVKTGDVEAPNPCMVEEDEHNEHKAKWPPRGQAAERRPDWPPREVPYECDPSALNSTGTCKPKDELTVLKSPASIHVEVKTWHEGQPPWKGSVDSQKAHLEARSRASSPTEKDAP